MSFTKMQEKSWFIFVWLPIFAVGVFELSSITFPLVSALFHLSMSRILPVANLIVAHPIKVILVVTFVFWLAFRRPVYSPDCFPHYMFAVLFWSSLLLAYRVCLVLPETLAIRDAGGAPQAHVLFRIEGERSFLPQSLLFSSDGAPTSRIGVTTRNGSLHLRNRLFSRLHLYVISRNPPFHEVEVSSPKGKELVLEELKKLEDWKR